MCTVSFVNSNGKYIITSNRDEKVAREKAIEPKIHLINDKKIFFPKDQKAGGTWYAVDDKAHIVVLLNGAKEKHELKSNYKKSRGLIVLDLISSESVILSWREINLDNIEPFTLVVFENQKLYQLQWNELDKEILPYTTCILDYLKEWLGNKNISFQYVISTEDFILKNASVLKSEITLFNFIKLEIRWIRYDKIVF